MRTFKILLAAFMLLFLGRNEHNLPLKIYFFDVGQAECIFIKLPDGQNMLIAAGNDADGRHIVNHLYGIGVKKIDILVATHPHEDHIGGMDEVINAFYIDKIYAPPIMDDDIPDTLCYNDYINALKSKNLSETEISAGDQILTTDNISISCLSPKRENYAVLNEYSVVLKIEFKSKVFILMSDAEQNNESEMLSSGIDLTCDLLKIGHHGSLTSSSKAFIGSTLPRYAIISAGRGNEYGHPSKSVLRRLNSIGAQIYRTDILGTLSAESDGEIIRIKSYNICLDGDKF